MSLSPQAERRPLAEAALNNRSGEDSTSVTDATDETAPFQVMPPLTAEQYHALRSDIETHGVKVPILVDQRGRIIDGHNRFSIATELGVYCPRNVQVVADEEEALDLAVTLNCARRHLNREQLRAVIRHELDRRPDDSDRAVARRVGCDHKTVGSVRRGGEIPQMGHTTDLTREEAEQLTTSIKAHLQAARETIAVLVCRALSNKVSAAEIVMALTMAQRRFATDKAANPEIVEVFTVAIFTPLIDSVMDPAAADYWRPHWAHETFEPLTDEERGELLSAIALVGGDDQ